MSGLIKTLSRRAGRTRPRATLALLLLGATALALSACGGEAATPTPAGLSAREVLDGAALAMADVTSFRFRLENKGGDTPIPGGMALRSAEGAMAKPDKLSAEIKAIFSGFLVEVRVVSVDQRTYLSDPITGSWRTYESSVSPIAFFDPAVGVNLILKSMTEVSLGDVAAVGGVPIYRVRGRLPAGAAQFIAGSYAEGSILNAELLIGTRDLFLREIRLEGRVTEEESEGIVRTLSFSDFNKPLTIEPPV